MFSPFFFFSKNRHNITNVLWKLTKIRCLNTQFHLPLTRVCQVCEENNLHTLHSRTRQTQIYVTQKYS